MRKKLLSPDLTLTDDQVRELEQPVTDEQFSWLEEHGLLDNGKTYEENRRTFLEPTPEAPPTATTLPTEDVIALVNAPVHSVWCTCPLCEDFRQRQAKPEHPKGRPAGFIIDVPVTLSVGVRGEGLTAASAKAIARKFVDDIAPTNEFLGGYSSVLMRQRNAAITEVSLESSREETCEVLDELEAEDADGEPIQTVSLAAIAPKRFAVVNLATDDQPQGFDTIEEARIHVAMGFLTKWEIWDGDTILEHS